ncbi:MAG: sodium-translocating pyrophosphatase, partial [Rhodospirillaceae bacterium]|nr:sodium-translocating pyrophosphatase [Rhodospirillaceae bacterium]
MTAAYWLVLLCGVLAVAYGMYAIRVVTSASAGNERMQEIATAIQEGANAYLNRQYTTIAAVGVVIGIILGFMLNWYVAIGYSIGAIL